MEIKRELETAGLLTLGGAGDLGKACMAFEAARGLLDSDTDGVWLVELAPISEGKLLPQAAGALGVLECPKSSSQMR
jgi:non-specific serine/threonine protein kinase